MLVTVRTAYVFLPLKVVLCFHFHFCLSSLLVCRVCSGRGGGGLEPRHIIRRVLIGCRVSPDTAVIVFCRGSPCPWHELCAVEWSSTTVCDIASVLESASDDVNTVLFCNGQVDKERDPGLISCRSANEQE